MSLLKFIRESHNCQATTSFLSYDPYIERFWQPILGPTATGLINLLMLESYTSKEFTFNDETLSARIGTGSRTGSSSPLRKQLNRLSQHKIISCFNDQCFGITPSIPQLPHRLLRRLEHYNSIEHDEWMTRLQDNPLRTQMNKAHHLVMVMTMMGYPNTSIALALECSGLHPSIIGKILAIIHKKVA